MNKQKIIYRGAEAVLTHATYHGRSAVLKKRIPKSYRIKEIDDMLRAARTKEEAKLFAAARHAGVSVPIIYDVDLTNACLLMEFINGQRIKDILNQITDEKRNHICSLIGKNIAKLHNYDIIHGDITTSNMILLDDKIYFIDFGLGCVSSETEIKAVDLHVLMEAYESTHSQHPSCFSSTLIGYQQVYKGNVEQVIKTVDDIVKRGRYR